MGKHVDISGHRHGMLTVVRRAERGTTERGWLCLCDCGKEIWLKKHEVTNHTRKSCGCWYVEYQKNKRVYGANNHRDVPGFEGPRVHMPEYSVWRGMKRRCFDTKCKSYADYGGRGVSVCERWLTFENFIADMGCRPSNQHQIDRENNSGDYEPGNCRWVLQKFQARNTRRNPVQEFHGVRMSVSDWADFFGVRPKILYQQVSRVGTNEALARHASKRCVYIREIT